MAFCDSCGFQLKDDDNFCPSCGKESIAKGPAKQLSGNENPYSSNQNRAPTYQSNQNTYSRPPPPFQPSKPTQYQQQYQPPYNTGYQNQIVKRAVNAPFNYRIAPLGDRIIAYFIDGCITSFGMCFCYLPGIIYALFKDGMREGRSFGKGASNLRVINFNTGYPATPMESCIRNVCNVCVCWLFFEPNQRHIGDLIAGTIVIKDE
jgi:uncharacterized RDD family membrane protein YckC